MGPRRTSLHPKPEVPPKPVYRCEFRNWCDADCRAVASLDNVFLTGPVRARVKLLEAHAKIGGPDSPDSFTVTSQVLRIDFEARTIETRNSIYRY